MRHVRLQRRQFVQTAALTLGTALSARQMAHGADPAASDIRRLPVDPLTGGSRAVIVSAPVMHLEQFSGADLKIVFADIAVLLGKFNLSWKDWVKLHVVARSDEIVKQVREQIEQTISADQRPAITYVVGPLANPNDVVALDGVIVPGSIFPKGLFAPNPSELSGTRPTLYIAGQAEKGESLIAATRATMESLKRTLELYGLDLRTHTDQIKSFVTPIADQAAVTDVIKSFFGKSFFDQDHAPALVFVEWKSTLPIEIELVAELPREKFPADATGPIHFATPKGMTSSPVFSRVSMTRSPASIYIGGLYGEAGTSGEAQVRSIFAQLKEILRESGSDLRHLAKATYYVANDDVSKQLNVIRPEFYDPARPPSASKAQVAGVGFPGRSITLDMIAVPKG